MNTERKGEWFVITQGILWAFFPIVTILSLKNISSILALAYATAFACLFFFFIFLYKKRFKELQSWTVWKYSLVIALCNGILFYVLYFYGLTKTTPGNASLIGLFETFTSFLLFTIIHKEIFKREYRIGSIFMIIGAVIILFKNFSGINTGDLFILLATCFAPMGNMYQKKLKKIASTETVLFIRTLISAPVLFLLAYFMGVTIYTGNIYQVLPFLILNGVIILGVSKILWVEAIHRISVTKAIALSAFTPFITLVMSWVILGQVPTIWQIISLPFLIIGMLMLTDNFTFIKWYNKKIIS